MTKKTALRPDDFLQYRYLSDLAASPDKQHAVFVVSTCDIRQNKYVSTLHIFSRADESVRQLTSHGNETQPVWLNNATVLFASLRDDALQERIEAGETWSVYYAISLSGGEAVEYMRIPMNVKSIAPLDENRFVILALFNNREPDPMALNAAARAEVLKRKKEKEESYASAEEIPFRLDWMGFTDGLRERLYLFDRRDGSLMPISDEEQKVEFYAVDAKHCRVIFSARRYGKDAPLIFKGNIASFDLTTMTLREYIDEDCYRTRFVGFLGETPVFMGSEGKRYYYQENPWFYLIDEDTGKEHCFAQNELSASNAVGTDIRYGSGRTIEAFQDHIYFVGTDDGDAHLKRAGLDGRIETLTTEGGAVDAIAVCDDEVLFIGLRENRLQELYACRLSDGSERRLSAFNEWVQETRTLSAPRHLPFCQGEIELDGWVMEPVGFDPQKSYPAILYIHGGHKLCYGSVFFHELQVYANLGYFVLYANPRGSDGRDNEFADIIGRYGFDDFEDLMRFTDVCLEEYPTAIDSNRLGVGGGSYGGFMTNWIVGHTDRFAAAVSQRSIASFLSMFGTSDTSYQFPLFSFDSDPWQDVERYWEHSPLKYANRVKTPVLLIHSQNDYRCPVSEAEQFFTALKYHGVESRLCVFKGEGHELSRSGKPKNRVNRLHEIIAWFERFLK